MNNLTEKTRYSKNGIDKEIYFIDENRLMQGLCRYYSNYHLEYQCYYKDDKLDGEMIIFNYQDNISEIINYKDDKKHGLNKKIYDNGNLEEICYYVDNIKNGPCKTYHESINERLESECNYINGMINGEKKYYNLNGELVGIKTYVNDNLEGYYKRTCYNGTRIECYYLQDKLHGPYKEYMKDILILDCNYVNGNKDGFERKFNNKGEILHEYIFKNGRRNGLCTEYKKNMIKSQCIYEKGRLLDKIIQQII